MAMDSTTQNLTAVLLLISELAHRSTDASYVYRGEPAEFEDISSSLYRQYKDRGIDEEGSAIQAIQNEIISQARRHEPQLEDMRDFEILAQIQHNDGKTNLIDFTTDYLIALFFACDGEPSQPGRIILLSETGEGYHVDQPTSPIHRVVAQKSVFVLPDKGYVVPDNTVSIPAHLKQPILEHLHRHHGISTETIYNDIHGFIKHQDIRQDAYNELYTGITLANQGNHGSAVQHYNKALTLNSRMATAYSHRGDAHFDLEDYASAIADYKQALSFDPENDSVLHNLGLAYAAEGNYHQAIQYYNRALEINSDEHTRYFRFEAYLLLNEWDKARQEIRFAALGWVNISALLHEYHASVSEFEQENNVKLPPGIADLLARFEAT